MAADTLWTFSANTGSVGNSDYPSYINKSGFTAFGGGERDKSGNYISKGERVEWWSSTDNNGQPWARKLHNDNVDLEKLGNTKNSGKYIRCLKD